MPALEALLNSSHQVAAVYTQPDRPAGRGRRVTMSPVKQCALRHGLPVEQPGSLRDAAAVQDLARRTADLMVVAAYGLILPPAVLALPRLGCVNIHASLLPRWRGAAPIQRAILAGDRVSGVTIMQMDAGLDTGPMLLERASPIEARDTSATLHDRLAALGADAIVQAVDALANGTAQARPQPETGVTYAAKLRKEEALIDWSAPACHIDRQVRAFNPWPIAETRWQGRQLRLWEAYCEDTPATTAGAVPGTVVAADATGLRVATGRGTLRVTQVQIAGRKAQPAADFVNAHRLEGAVLGT